MILAEKESQRFLIINAQQKLAKVEKDVELALNDFRDMRKRTTNLCDIFSLKHLYYSCYNIVTCVTKI